MCIYLYNGAYDHARLIIINKHKNDINGVCFFSGVYLAAGANASGGAMPSPLSSGGRNHPLRSESRSYASCDLDPVMEERSEMDSSCGGVAGGGGPVAGVGAVADGGGIVGGGAVEALVCPDS